MAKKVCFTLKPADICVTPTGERLDEHVGDGQTSGRGVAGQPHFLPSASEWLPRAWGVPTPDAGLTVLGHEQRAHPRV